MGRTLSVVVEAVEGSRGYHHGDLPAALRAAALQLVAERGAGGLSIAEAARRAGVSSAAPYRHYDDRDALLADLAVRALTALAERLRTASGGPPWRRCAR